MSSIRTLTGRAAITAVLSLALGTLAGLTATSAAAAPPAVLGSGGVLPCGNRLASGDYRLEMQCDGNLVEYGETSEIFTNPRIERTKDYITGRYG